MGKVRKFFKKELFWLGFIFLLVVWQTRFLFGPGFYTFSDEPHLANLHQMVRAIVGKQLPPRWAPDMSFNFGYPLFNFYYPLPFYLGAFFHLLFKVSLVWSLKLVFFLSVLLSGLACYFLSRKFFNQVSSFAAAVVYLYTPYRAVDLYVRGAVGEMWGFVFMPLVFLAFVDLTQKRNVRSLIFASFSLAGLMLAHNLTPIIFLPFFVIAVLTYLLFVAPGKGRLRAFGFFCLTFIWGLALSAYCWLPAIFEKRYIQPGTPFNPYDHFPFIRQLIIPSWGYGASVWGPDDQMSFQIGLVNLAAFFVGAWVLVISRKKLIKKQWWLLSLLILLFLTSVFLMNIRSWFIWEWIPLASYVQFPWRFLMLTTFASSLLVGVSQKLIKTKWGKALPLLLAGLSVALTAGYFRPAKRLDVDDDYYLQRFFINQTSSGESQDLSGEYFNYSEDYLPLTIWTKKRPESLPEKIEVIDSRAEISVLEKTPTDFEIGFRGLEKTTLLINSYYFPGWEAKVDGRQTEIWPAYPLGQIELQIPAGEHLVQVRFRKSLFRKIGEAISLSGVLLIIVVGLRQKILGFVLKWTYEGSKSGRNDSRSGN